MPATGAAASTFPPMNRTFVMCKPDAVARGLVGEVIGRIEAKGPPW
jgi:nucleoside-diphosphate kinase